MTRRLSQRTAPSWRESLEEEMMENQAAQEFGSRDVLIAVARKRWLIAATTAIFAVITTIVTARMKPIYQATSQFQLHVPESAGGLLGGEDADTFRENALLLFSNDSVAAQISKTLHENGYNITAGTVHGALSVMNLPGSDLINVSARSTSPAEARAIADAGVFGFRDYRRQVSDEAALRDTETMRSRVQQAGDAMEKAMNEMAQFQNSHGYYRPEGHSGPGSAEGMGSSADSSDSSDSSDEGSSNKPSGDKFARIGELEAALTQIASDIDVKVVKADLLRRQLAEQDTEIRSGGRDDALIMTLRAHLADDQAQLQKIQQTYVNFSALADPIRADIEDTQRRLRVETNKAINNSATLESQGEMQVDLRKAENALALLRARQHSLQDQLAAAKSGMKALAAVDQEFTRLVEIADVARGLYQKAVEAYQAHDMERFAHPDTIEVTQLASLPHMRISPKRAEDLVLAIVFGLIVGILLAVLLEFLDDTVRTEDDLRRLAPDIPILGVMPVLRQSEFKEHGGLSSTSRGPYRLLWTNISFEGLDAPIHTIVMTSTAQGEGKSMTCAYLARAAAEEGKRVILVDCDLRRPAQHRAFGLTNDLPGLCEVLSGKISLNEALLPTDDPGLMLLVAGQSLPLNPSVLFKSDRFRQFLQDLEQQSDFVILDAPPALAISDALILSTHGPGVIQVVESGRGRRDHVRKVIESLRRARARQLGIVLNKVPKHGFGYGSYYYNYYYYHHNDKEKRNSADSSGTNRGPGGGSVTTATLVAGSGESEPNDSSRHRRRSGSRRRNGREDA